MRWYTAILLVVGAASDSLASDVGQSWTTPRKTDSARITEEQLHLRSSPTPTPPPQARGLLGRMNLVPRSVNFTLGSDTCGIEISDNTPYPITCISRGMTCDSLSGYLGCCWPNQECSVIKTACLDYAASRAGSCNSVSDSHTVCCDTASLPKCFTQFRTAEGSTLTHLDCSATGGTGFLNGTTPTPPPSPSPSTSNAGAIAGGVVGGVVGLAIIGAVVFLLFRRRRQGNGRTISQTPMAQSQPQSPPPPGYGPCMSLNDRQSYAPQDGYEPYRSQSQGEYPPHEPGFVPKQQQQQPNELPAVAPRGHGDNRAELGSY